MIDIGVVWKSLSSTEQEKYQRHAQFLLDRQYVIDLTEDQLIKLMLKADIVNGKINVDSIQTSAVSQYSVDGERLDDN